MDKKLDRDLRANLKKEERKNDLIAAQDGKYESYFEAAIIFFGTLWPLYFLFFLAYHTFMFVVGLAALNMVSLPFSWIFILIHAAIWIVSIYSVYRKRSILDDFVRWL